MLYNIIGYDNQVIGQVEASNQVEAWEGAGKMYNNVLDVRLEEKAYPIISMSSFQSGSLPLYLKEIDIINEIAKESEWVDLTISRKSPMEYDLDIDWVDARGRKGSSYLPLTVIGSVNWSDNRIWQYTDAYGPKGYIPPQGYDWSGVRDSSNEAIWSMFSEAMVMRQARRQQ